MAEDLRGIGSDSDGDLTSSFASTSNLKVWVGGGVSIFAVGLLTVAMLMTSSPSKPVAGSAATSSSSNQISGQVAALSGLGTAPNTALGGNGNYTIDGTLRLVSSGASALTVSGNEDVQGNLSVSTLTPAGVVFSNSAGLLRTGLITNSNLSAGHYSNVTGVGALASGALGNGFSTVNVAQGGTGITSTTKFGLIAGGITATSGFQNVGPGTSGQVLTSNGPNALPTWATPLGGSGGTCSVCLLEGPATTAQNTIAPSGDNVVALTVNETSGASADILDLQSAGGTPLVTVDFKGVISGDGAGLTLLNATNLTLGTVPSGAISGDYGNITGVGTLTSGALGVGFTPIAVGQGGTGTNTFTVGGVLYGNGTDLLQATDVGDVNNVLIGNGSGSAPSFTTIGSLLSAGENIQTISGATPTIAVSDTPTFSTVTATGAQFLGATGSNNGVIVLWGSDPSSGAIIVEGPSSPNTGDYTLSIPAITADSNLCTDNSLCAGYGASSGNGNYIINGSSQQGGANFNIDGSGTAASFLAANIDTASAGTLNIGATNATTINLGASDLSQTINVGNSTGSTGVTIAGGSSGIKLNAANAGAVGGWNTNGNALPDGIAYGSSFVANGYVYVVGGVDVSGYVSTVYYAPLNLDGSVGAWSVEANPLPVAQVYKVAAYGGYAYAFGDFGSSVYYAQLNGDGTTGAWTTSVNALPATLLDPAMVASNGYVFVVGGYDVNANTPAATVYDAVINPDGSIGAWSTDPHYLPAGLDYGTAQVANGTIYYIGGRLGNSQQPQTTILYASINPNGSTGVWNTNARPLPYAVDGGTSAMSNGYMYVLGGYDGVNNRADVYYAAINGDGSIGAWDASPNHLPSGREVATSVVANGYVYEIGGFPAGGGFSTTVLYAPVGAGGAPDSTVLSVDTNNDQAVLGTSAGLSGTLLFNSAAGTGSVALTVANPGNTAYSLVLPAEDGTLCSTGSVCIGYAADSGDSNYIANGTAQQFANFNIAGSGTADSLFANNFDTAAAGTLNLGTTNATTVNVATNGINHDISIATGAGSQSVAVGSTDSNSSLTLRAGTGGIDISSQGTAPINVGANAVAQTINIGNSTGATTVGLAAGTGGLDITTQGTGALNIGANAIAQTINIGNTTGSTAVTIGAGTGNVTFNASGAGGVGSWNAGTGLPRDQYAAGSVVANGYVYEIGGETPWGESNQVWYAALNGDGSLAGWNAEANTLPDTGRYTATVSGGYVYAYDTDNNAQSVYYAQLNGDGTTGAWNVDAGVLPYFLNFTSIASSNGYIYLVGGSGNGSPDVSTVFYAQLNPDGSTNGWATSPQGLPSPRADGNVVANNGYLYYLGGFGSSGVSSNVYYASINPNGSTGFWQTNVQSMPNAVSESTSLVSNGYVYVMGGGGNGGIQSSVYYAAINGDGSVGSWNASNPLTIPVAAPSSVVNNGYIYVLGGWDNGWPGEVSYASLQSPPQVSVLTVDTTNGRVVLGSAAGLTGSLVFYGAGSTGSVQLSVANPGWSAFSLTLPAENGALCSTGSVCSGYAPSGGDADIAVVGTLTSGALGNGFSTVGVAQGGTGLSATTAFGLLAGGVTSTGALQSLDTGNSGDVLVSGGSGALPTWQTFNGGCPACLLQTPATTAQNTIAPTADGVVGLTLQETSGASADILDIQSSTGSPLVSVSAAGSVAVGGVGTPTGQLYVSGSAPVDVSSGGAATGSVPYGLYVQGRYGYVVNQGSNTLQVFDLSDPTAPTSVGISATTGLNGPDNIYVQGRFAYVTNSLGNTLQVFDVSNPSNPVSVGSVPTAGGPYSLYVQGRYAYVEGNPGDTLQVFDVSNPADPVSVGSVSTGTDSYGMYVQGSYAYVAVNNGGGGALEIYSVNDPAHPTFAGSAPAAHWGLSAVYVQGRYAYALDTHFNAADNTTLVVYDVSDPSNPVQVGSGVAGFAEARSLVVQGRFAYATSRQGNRIMSFDVSNPTNPTLIGSAATVGQPYLGLAVEGRYAYVTGVYNGGGNTLQAYDIGGAYLQQLQAGGLEVGTLQTQGNATVNGDVALTGGLQIGAGLQVAGGAAVNNAGSTDGLDINLTGAATNPNGIQIVENNAGGTLTNGLQIGQIAGTVTNGIVFSGTIGTDIITDSSANLSLDTGGANAITIGDANAATIAIGNNDASHTINIGAGASTAAQTINIGSASSTGTTTILSGSGGVVIGSGGNAATFSGTTGELTFGGTARHTKQIVLTAEYAGAVFDATNDPSCAAANAGTMSSWADGSFNTYYNWTNSLGSAQCYDVLVRVPVPSDWSAWASGNVMTVQTWVDSTSNDGINVAVNDDTGAVESGENYVSITPGSPNSLTTYTDAGTFAGTYAANGVFTVRIRMSAKSSGNTRIGTITLTYLSKF